MPKAAVFHPLNNGKEFLLLTRFPADNYRRIYKVAIATGAHELVYDAGQSVGWIQPDKANKRFYLGIDNKGDEQYGVFELDIETKKVSKIIGHKDRRASIVSTDRAGNPLRGDFRRRAFS